MDENMRRERGVVAVTAALGLFVVLGIAALAVDFGMLVAVRTQLGTAADAAALAAVKELPFGSRERARFRAVEYANQNVALGDSVALDIGETGGDVVLGFYDLGARSFKPDDLLPNAVRVTARRSAERGTGVPTFFASLLGRPLVDVSVRSTAIGFPRECIVAVDASGSMGRWEPGNTCIDHRGAALIIAAREAAAEFIGDLGASTLPERAGVLSFASDPVVRSPVVGLHDPGQPALLIQRTLAMQAERCGEQGGTNTGRAIERAIAMFEQADPGHRDLGQRMLVVLSDGLANRGRHGEDVYQHEDDDRNPAWRYAVEAAQEARAKHIVVHTIALLDNNQQRQMQEIAEVGGGMYLFSPTTEDLDRMFESLARVVQVALVD